MKSETESTWLVTGASGNLGRRVVELLLEKGGARIIAGSRDTAKLADLAAKGAELRTIDFDRPENLTEAFRGVDRLLLVSTDAIVVPGQRIAQHEAAIRAAEEAGVRHLVYTSTVDAEEDSALLVAPDHLATERALGRSTLGYTVLRNNSYADNLLPGLAHSLATRKWFSAAGEGGVTYVTREDCAAAAAGAIASDYDGRRTFEVTGPRAWKTREVAEVVSQITGRPLEVIDVPLDALVAGIIASGLPEGVARLIGSFDEAAARGRLAPLTDAVAELAGRPPQDLEGFLARLSPAS